MDQLNQLQTFVKDEQKEKQTDLVDNNKDQRLIQFISDSDQQISENSHQSSVPGIQCKSKRQLLADIIKWININWQKFQLIAVAIILLILASGLYLIYESSQFPNLQFQNQTAKNNNPLFHMTKVKDKQMIRQNSQITQSKANNIEKIQMKQKQLKGLKLQSDIANRRKKIQNMVKKYQLETNKESDQIYSTKIFNNNIKDTSQEKRHRNFPKMVWMYIEQDTNIQSNLIKTLITNMGESMAENGYELYIIRDDNFNQIINPQNGEKIKKMLSNLKQTITKNNDSSSIQANYLNVKKLIISLTLLSQNGGILIDKDIILTKDLSWLQNLHSIEYINKGRSEKASIVGFYNKHYTNQPEQIMISQYENRTINLYPSLNPYFVAVSKQGRQYIKLILDKYYLLLSDFNNLKLFKQESKLHIFREEEKNPFLQSYFVSSLMVLEEKQLKLDIEWINRNQEGMRQLAIDYYGIYTINQLYGPERYLNLFGNKPIQEIYFLLSKVQNSQIARFYGNIAFMTFIPFQNQIAQYLEKAQSGHTKYSILKNSFFDNYIYKRYLDAEFIIQALPHVLKYQISNDPVLWDTLPKIIWIYHQRNVDQNILQMLCLNTIEHSALQSGFTINILTQSNIEQYINISIINSIFELNHSSLTKDTQQSKTNLIKLTILKKYGGVWIQLPLFTIQNFNWLLNIHQNPYAINKIGKTPKVLIFYQPIASGFHWIVSNDSSIKLNEHLSYQNNFIAAEPNSYLITEWYNEFYSNLHINEQDLDKKIRQQYKIVSFDITKDVKDIFSYSLGYVLQNENTELQTHMSKKNIFMEQKCGLWILNGFIGSEKLKESTNYQQLNQINTYLWSHSESQVIDLLGQFHYFVSLNKPEQQFLNKELAIKLPDISHIKINQQSIFYNHLYNPQLIKDILIYDKPQIPIQKESINQTIAKIIWLYISEHELQQEVHRKRYMNNIFHYSEGYAITFINSDNYNDFISDKYHEGMHSVLEEIDYMTNFSPQNILKMKKTIIILAVLIQNGGIFIDNSVILTESLDWIYKISQNPFVNGGIKTINNVIGFFSANYNPQILKHQFSSLIKYPTLQPFFIAAVKDTAYINDLFSQYLKVVRQKNIELTNQLNNDPLKIQAIEQIELFYNASYLILQNRYLKQQEKGLNNIQYSVTGFYGLTLINSRYFPQKLNYIYYNQPEEYLLNSISYISQEQLIGYIGPLRYMIKIQNHSDIYKIISKIKITNLSFLANHFYLAEEEDDFGVSHAIKTNSKTVWKDLPKVIWYYKSSSGKQNQIDGQIKKKVLSMANEAGINVIQVSKKNLGNYINKESLNNINSIMAKVKLGVDSKSLTFVLYKLALLYKYGGIFLSNQFMPVDNLTWILNVGQSNKFIYNNYGSMPKVLTFFKSTNSRYFYNYTIDEKYGIKVNENITILNNFIAAAKNSLFINELFNQILHFVVLSDLEIKSLFKQHQIDINYRKIEVQDLVSTLSTYILAKRAKILKNLKKQISSYQYYGIWSINEDVGPNKWLVDLNLQSDVDEIPKLSLWFEQKGSQYVNGVIGRPHYLIFLSPTNRKNLSQMISEKATNKLSPNIERKSQRKSHP